MHRLERRVPPSNNWRWYWSRGYNGEFGLTCICWMALNLPRGEYFASDIWRNDLNKSTNTPWVSERFCWRVHTGVTIVHMCIICKCIIVIRVLVAQCNGFFTIRIFSWKSFTEIPIISQICSRLSDISQKSEKNSTCLSLSGMKSEEKIQIRHLYMWSRSKVIG